MCDGPEKAKSECETADAGCKEDREGEALGSADKIASPSESGHEGTDARDREG